MSDEINPSEDARLRARLREAHPADELPPGFKNAVWRRIEQTNENEQPRWIDAVAVWLFRPRFALASLAAVMLLGTLLGLAAGDASKDSAQALYVMAVDPFQKQP